MFQKTLNQESKKKLYGQEKKYLLYIFFINFKAMEGLTLNRKSFGYHLFYFGLSYFGYHLFTYGCFFIYFPGFFTTSVDIIKHLFFVCIFGLQFVTANFQR